MPAYVIVDIDVTDAAKFETYKRLATVATAKYGGRYLVRGGDPVSVEGDWATKRITVLEFADRAAAQRWHASPECAAAIRSRAGAARFRSVLVDGVATA